MAGYKIVYAPTGEMFEVPESRANELILQEGWTQQRPNVSSLSEKNSSERSPKRRARRKSASISAEELTASETEVANQGSSGPTSA